MNEILDDYLCKKYPKILVERELSPRESCMGRGFECGNGWFMLLDSLFNNIQLHIDHPPYVYKKDPWTYIKRGYEWIARKLHLPYKYWPNYANMSKESVIPQFKAVQVKEKFGALRIYADNCDEYCHGLVNMAATLSVYICEECGKGGPEVGKTEGWIQALCADCSKKKNRPITYRENANLLKKVQDEEKNKNKGV